jgi:hypothetical protein
MGGREVRLRGLRPREGQPVAGPVALMLCLGEREYGQGEQKPEILASFPGGGRASDR